MASNTGSVDQPDRVLAAAEVIRKVLRANSNGTQPANPLEPYLQLRANAAGVVGLSYTEIISLNRFVSTLPHHPASEIRQNCRRALGKPQKILDVVIHAELSKQHGAPFSETLIPLAQEARRMTRAGENISPQEIVPLLNAFRADNSEPASKHEAWYGLFSRLDAQAASFYHESLTTVSEEDLLLLPEIIRRFGVSLYYPRHLVEEVGSMDFREALARLKFWAIIEIVDAIWEIGEIPERLGIYAALQWQKTADSREVHAIVKFARALAVSNTRTVATILEKTGNLFLAEEIPAEFAGALAIAASIAKVTLPDSLWQKLYSTWQFLDPELPPGMVMTALQGTLNNLDLRFAFSHPIGPYRIDCVVFPCLEDPTKLVAFHVTDERAAVANAPSASRPGPASLRTRYLEEFGVREINLPLSRWMPLDTRDRMKVLEHLIAGRILQEAFAEEDD